MPREFLHAYWRMPYITAPAGEGTGTGEKRGNPFRALAEADPSPESLVLLHSTHSFLVMNKFPYNAGHLLAVTRREVPDPEDLTGEEFTDLNQTILRAKKLLRLALNPDGFNIGYNLGAAAGAGIPRHLHGHIVPRWTGDTNFMPVIGDTRVLPEAMAAMWERLHGFIDQTDV